MGITYISQQPQVTNFLMELLESDIILQSINNYLLSLPKAKIKLYSHLE